MALVEISAKNRGVATATSSKRNDPEIELPLVAALAAADTFRAGETLASSYRFSKRTGFDEAAEYVIKRMNITGKTASADLVHFCLFLTYRVLKGNEPC